MDHQANLNRFLETYQFSEFHTITIHTSKEAVWKTLNEIDFMKSKVIQSLFFLRGMQSHSVKLDDLKKFINPVFIEENQEIILCSTEKAFWGTCTLAWNFYLQEIDGKTTELSTETRVFLPSRKDFLAFRCYWLFIEPFSRLIRRIMLSLIKKEAES